MVLYTEEYRKSKPTQTTTFFAPSDKDEGFEQLGLLVLDVEFTTHPSSEPFDKVGKTHSCRFSYSG